MDKKEFYEKSEKIINETFEAVKKYAKIVAEKTGEAAHITKLLAKKMILEHQMTQCFSKLGHKVYQQVTQPGEKISLDAPEIRGIMEETKKLGVELAQVETVLETERKAKAAKPKAIKKKTN